MKTTGLVMAALAAVCTAGAAYAQASGSPSGPGGQASGAPTPVSPNIVGGVGLGTAAGIAAAAAAAAALVGGGGASGGGSGAAAPGSTTVTHATTTTHSATVSHR